MEYGIQFSETGHLVLATLHANSANQALDRIINFFLPRRAPRPAAHGSVAEHKGRWCRSG